MTGAVWGHLRDLITPRPGVLRVLAVAGDPARVGAALGPVAGGALTIAPDGAVVWRPGPPDHALPTGAKPPGGTIGRGRPGDGAPPELSALADGDIRQGRFALPGRRALPGRLALDLEADGAPLSLTLDLSVLAPRPAGVFGAETRPGAAALWTGAERITGGDRRGHWALRDGWLMPAAAGLDIRGYALDTDAGPVPIRVAAHAASIGGADDLVATLAQSAAALSGRTLLFRPGPHDLTGVSFYGAFTGLTAPVTLASEDPGAPAVLTGWTVAGPEGVPIGPLTFRDLAFHRDQADFTPGRNLHLMRLYPNARGVTVERCRFSSDLGPARDGAALVAEVRGVDARDVAGLAIRNCHFEGLAHALSLSGTDIAVTGNVARRNWADFLQLHPRSGAGDSARIRVADNTFSDMLGDGRVLHPDFIHIYPRGRDRGTVEDVVVEGNVVFMGREGVRMPPQINLHPEAGAPPRTRSGPLGAEVQTRLVQVDAGAGEVRLALPEGMADAAGKPLRFGVQKVDGAPAPVRLVLPRGVVFADGDRRVQEVVLDTRWQTVELTARPGQRLWTLRRSGPTVQGIFANAMADRAPLRRFVVRGNILWLNSAHGISSIGPVEDWLVEGNSLIPPLPGDANGDGRADDGHDGYRPGEAAQIMLSGRAVRIRGNIAGAAGPSRWVREGADPTLEGNLTGVSSGPVSGLMRALGRRSPDAFQPENREAAIALARPATRGRVGAEAYWDFERRAPR